jgi:hypothetical protein
MSFSKISNAGTALPLAVFDNNNKLADKPSVRTPLLPFSIFTKPSKSTLRAVFDYSPFIITLLFVCFCLMVNFNIYFDLTLGSLPTSKH